MAKTIPFALILVLSLVTMAFVSSSSGEEGVPSLKPKPCCMPEQFTHTNVLPGRKLIIARETVDYPGKRKMVEMPYGGEFYYFNFSSGLYYHQNIFGGCSIAATPYFSIFDRCIPEDAELVEQQKLWVNQHLEVNAWKINTTKSTGVITVTEDECFPFSSVLTDKATDSSFTLVYSDSKKEIDDSVFPTDLSHCEFEG